MRDWSRLERRARAQVRKEVIEAARVPLLYGQRVAWATCCCGKTDGFSPVHRVGLAGKALCGVAIPPAILRTPAGLEPSLDVCQACERLLARVDRRGGN